MKINGNKVPCGIDFLSIAWHDRPLETYFSTGADWLINNEGDFRSLFMSPANISLTKGKDTLCQMGWGRDRLKLSKNDQDDMLDN